MSEHDRRHPGRSIEVVPELTSTNAALLARIGTGETLHEGTWLIADRQTGGRGRAGRSWADGAGNFMGSTVAVLRPDDPPAQTLALVAGLAAHGAAAAALAEAGADVTALLLKWPNDLLIAGAKLAGILLERSRDTVVVGIGVNLAAAPLVPDRPTAALAAHGVTLSRNAFADRIAADWQALLDRWHAGQWPQLRQEWTRRAYPVGTLLTISDPIAGPVTGAFAGIAEDGTAHLRLADGTRHAIHAGDVELVGVMR